MFKQSSDYHLFKDSSEYILPNVSYVVTEDIVNYHPLLIIPDIPEGHAEFMTADGMVFSASIHVVYLDNGWVIYNNKGSNGYVRPFAIID